MDDLKYVTKLAEALHDFAFKLEANADIFTKEDSTITISFNRLYHPSQLIELSNNQLKEDSSKFSINNTTQTPTVAHIQTKEQTPTNSNPLTNCTPEDFNSTKKVLKAALDSNPDLHTSNTLQNFIKNELPKLEKQTDALLKEELINQTKNRFNLLLERASSSTDVSVIYEALDLIDSLAYPNFEWDTTQVNLLYKKLND